MQRHKSTSGYHHPKRWISGTKVGGSTSMPNLRPTFKKSPPMVDSLETPPGMLLSQFKSYQRGNDVTSVPVGSRFRSNSMPSLMKSINFFSEYARPPHPVHIPSFMAQDDGFKNGSNVKNSSELIVGALRAGYAYFQRGMHYNDILALVRSASSGYVTETEIIKLDRALEKLVASGIVSKSYGGRPKDATYRLVMDNPNVSSISPTLYISGTKIQPNNKIRFTPGLCLPGGISHLTRKACSFPSKVPKKGDGENGQLQGNSKEQSFVPWMSHPVAANQQSGEIGLLNSNNFDCDLLPYEHRVPPTSPDSAASLNYQNIMNEPWSYASFSNTFGEGSGDCGNSIETNGRDIWEDECSSSTKGDDTAQSLYPTYDTLLERLRHRLQA